MTSNRKLILIMTTLTAYLGCVLPMPSEYSANGGRRDNIDERGNFIGGDMIFHEEQIRRMQDKSGILDTAYRWPQGVIPYSLDPEFTDGEKQTVIMAMVEIMSKTCIRFVEKSDDTPRYVNIVRGKIGSGCFSHVGMQPLDMQPQTVNLQHGSPGCIVKGVAAHELIHSIGYFHEQSRTDRDKFVTINFGNVEPAMAHNFDKLDETEVGTFNVTFDYDSVMLYSAYAFAIDDSKPTIIPKQENVALSRLGQRRGLSQIDAQKINNMYKDICES